MRNWSVSMMKECLILAAAISLRQSIPLVSASEPADARSVAIGAIRWDAWHAEDSDIGRAVQKSMSPKHWHGRLPFFAEVRPTGTVVIAGDSNEVMAREIAYAKAAGLDYWAFCAYSAQSPMSRGLQRYLNNPTRNDIRFCMIVDVTHWHPKNLNEEAARFADLMKHSNYQTVVNGRPLFYILNPAIESNAKAWSDAGGFKTAVMALREAARSHGLTDPYIVVMIPWPDKAKRFADETGCDAISAYAVQGGGKNAPFSDLTAYVENFWKRSMETGAKVVPLAMTGWDRRPRVESPAFWEDNVGWNADIDRFYQTPTPTQIAEHVRNAVDWTRKYEKVAEAQTVIVYAWNEHDEGGWLSPTLGEGDARARAMAKALSTQ